MKSIGVVVFALILFAVPFASAEENFLDVIVAGADSFYQKIVQPFGQFLLGGKTVTGEIFFAKLLLFILMLSVVWLVVGRFPLFSEKRKTGFVVAAIVSILSVRYISQDWLDTVILPYSVLGIALTSILPFVLYFFFVKDLPTKSMRKIAWIFAFFVFVGLFIYRHSPAGISPFAVPGRTWKYGLDPTYVYLLTAVASLLILWFDGTIQRALDKARYQDLVDIKKVERRAELAEQYDKVQERFAKKIISKVDANKMINSIKGRATAYGLDPNIFTVIA